MKNILLLVVLLFCVGFNISASAQKSKVVKTKYFQNLNVFDAAESYQWHTGSFEIAKALESSYNKFHTKKNFKKQLLKFTNNNIDKYYWVATYLVDDYYTQIKNKQLSGEFYTLGLALVENDKEEEQIRFLYVIGKKHYHAGEKEESLAYLIKAYQLSEKHPGHVPTWNSLEEAEEITKFIEQNI